MAVWSDIADSEIDPESPYTTTLATKQRENLVAALEGAVGAPRILHAAIRNAVAGAKVTANSLPEFGNAPSGVWTLTKEITMAFAGEYTVTFSGKSGNTNNESQIRVNDSVAGALRTNTSTYTTWTENITVNAGDRLQIYTKASNLSSATVKDFIIKEDQPLFNVETFLN